MARIAGVDIPNNKRVEIALTYIYGIGRKSSNDILAKTGINPDTRGLCRVPHSLRESDNPCVSRVKSQVRWHNPKDKCRARRAVLS